MAGGEEARLARLRRNWPRAQARLERTARVSLYAIPVVYGLWLLVLFFLWDQAYIRSIWILWALVLGPGLLYISYWFFPRALAISRLSFEDYKARRRMLLSAPRSKPLLLSWGLLNLGGFVAMLLGVAMVFTGPRTMEFVIGQVYPLVGIGLLILAASIAVGIPIYQTADKVLIGSTFAARQRLSAVLTAAVGVFVLALAFLSPSALPV